MLKFSILSMFLVPALAFSADKPKYITHFENPIVDERIAFDSCAVTGALMGILEGKPGDVLCSGSLKGETGPDKKVYYVFKAEGQSTLHYFLELEFKLVSAAGDQEAGAQEASLKLGELTKELESPNRAHVSTLKVRTEWTYSEGSTSFKGKLPGMDEKFDAPLFDLSSLDDELKRFAKEIEN